MREIARFSDTKGWAFLGGRWEKAQGIEPCAFFLPFRDKTRYTVYE